MWFCYASFIMNGSVWKLCSMLTWWRHLSMTVGRHTTVSCVTEASECPVPDLTGARSRLPNTQGLSYICIYISTEYWPHLGICLSKWVKCFDCFFVISGTHWMSSSLCASTTPDSEAAGFQLWCGDKY